MKVAGIEAQHLLAGNGIAQIIFVRADCITFTADTEKLALNCIQMQLGVNRFGIDFVQ